MHAIVTVLGQAIEVQVRTGLQHLWAEFSEKLSDRLGVEIKYGGGAEHTRKLLRSASKLVADLDDTDTEIQVISASLAAARDRRAKIAALKDQVRVLRRRLADSTLVTDPDAAAHRRKVLSDLAAALDQHVDVALEDEVLVLQRQHAELHETTRRILLSGIEDSGNQA